MSYRSKLGRSGSSRTERRREKPACETASTVRQDSAGGSGPDLGRLLRPECQVDTPRHGVFCGACVRSRGRARLSNPERNQDSGGTGRIGAARRRSLLRLGDADLRGVGPVAFVGLVGDEAGRSRRVPVVFERAGERREASLPLAFARFFLPFLAVSLAFAFTAVVLLLRAGPSPMVRAFSQAFLCIAVAFGCRFVPESVAEAYFALPVYVVSYTLQLPLSLRAALMFPHGNPPSAGGPGQAPGCLPCRCRSV